MNNKINKKTIITLIAACVFLIFSVGIFFFGLFKIKIISNKILDIEENISLLKDSAGRSAALSKATSSLKKVQDTLDVYFVQENNIPNLLEQIEAYGKTINVPVEFNGITTNTKTEDFITLTIKATGDFKSITMFTNYLDSLPYNSKITRVFLVSNVLDTSAPQTVDPKKKYTVPLPIWKAEYSLKILSFTPNQ